MMPLQLQLCFLVLVVRGMTGALGSENISVMEGKTLIISCSINDANVSVEWKNPSGHMLFFNSHKVLKDKRSSLVTFSHSEYTFSLTNITFKDGGYYRCLQYRNEVETQLFKVTVLGFPKLEMTEHEDRMAIKCSAEASNPSPRISWLFESGLQLEAPHAQQRCGENLKQPDVLNKCSSVDILLVKSHKRRVTVKCIVHHQALYNSHLMNFISIGKYSTEEQYSTATVGYWSSSADTTDQASQSTADPHSENNSNLTGNTTVAMTTASVSTNTSTNSSFGEGQNTWDQRDNERQSSPLLVLLVTCLILGLLVVVIFFLIKLRRAHIIWKIENENSEQSLESTRSKSSNEEKLSQERKLQISVINPGYQNTNFTRYIAEEPPAEAASNTQNEETGQVQRNNPNPCVVTTRPQIRETDL